MARILSLNPEDAKNLHPEAVKWFNDQRVKIQCEVPLEELSDDDLNTFLSDDEKREFMRSKDEITRGLATCINMDAASSDPLTNASIGLSLLTFQVNSLLPMYNIKSLLKKAYNRKREEQRKRENEERQQAEKAKEEQRRREDAVKAEQREREEEERWHVACRAVNPPIDDAKGYLDKPEEYGKFIKAARQAIEVYIEKREDYLNDSRTFDYRQYLRKINYGKEEEQIRNDAQAQAQAFATRLAEGLKEIERKLSPKKEGPAVIFKRWCSNNGESRYLGEPFTDILASEDGKNRKWKQGYIPVAEEKLQKSIPGELRDFILTEPTAAFFLLPSANYSYCGVPCLDFYFDVFAVVTITVSAQVGHKIFNGRQFNFLTNLRELELLGFYQIIITPNEPHFWQSVSISIIHALIDGNLQPPGTTVLKRTDQLTVYEVRKFEEDICEIPISFERYCRSLGSVEKMKEVQIIKERTAEILEPLRPISINHKESNSKKAKAFELFGEGKRPSDSEVKTLGIKPNSAYRYYQDWKRSSLSDIK